MATCQGYSAERGGRGETVVREMDERGDLEPTSTDAEDGEEAKGECEMQATPPRRTTGRESADG